MAAAPQHPAYRGIFDYDALRNRSNESHDASDADLRSASDYGGFNNTMNIIANSQNKQSPWAPYFQALQDQGVSKLGMDAGRPHGIADSPEWHMQGDVGALAQLPIDGGPLMQSTNIAAQQPIAGLRKVGR